MTLALAQYEEPIPPPRLLRVRPMRISRRLDELAEPRPKTEPRAVTVQVQADGSVRVQVGGGECVAGTIGLQDPPRRGTHVAMDTRADGGRSDAATGVVVKEGPQLRVSGSKAPVRYSDAVDAFVRVVESRGGSSPDYLLALRQTLWRAGRAMGIACDKNGERPTGMLTGFTEAKAAEYLLGAKIEPKTRLNYWAALYRFGAYCARKKLLPPDADGDYINPMAEIQRPLVPKREARLVPTDADAAKLVMACYGRKQQKDRWLVYLCALSVPVRWGTWRWLEVHHCRFDHGRPRLELPPHLVKSRREATVDLPPEVATHLKRHVESVADREPFTRRTREVCRTGRFVFLSVPKPEQVKKDAKRAGIPLSDDRGRTFSFHSLKHYASNRRMRLGWTDAERKIANDHTSLRMTEEVYTNTDLMLAHHPDIAGVIARTASMPPLLGTLPERSPERPGATKRPDFPVDKRASGRLDGVAESEEVNPVPTSHDQSEGRPTPQGARTQHSSQGSPEGRPSDGRGTPGREEVGVSAEKSGREDLNLRPPGPKPGALPS